MSRGKRRMSYLITFLVLRLFYRLDSSLPVRFTSCCLSDDDAVTPQRGTRYHNELVQGTTVCLTI